MKRYSIGFLSVYPSKVASYRNNVPSQISPKFRILVASIAAMLLAGSALTACGSDAADSETDSPTSEGAAPVDADGELDLEAAEGLVDAAVEDTAADARATVVFDGVTYEFKALPDDEWGAYCTTIAGSLQGSLQLTDDTGAAVEDASFTFTFLEPNSAYEANDGQADISLDLPPEDPNVIGPISYFAGHDDIDVVVSGRTASGTFTAPYHTGDISATVDVSC